MCFAHYKKNSYFVGIKNVSINKLVISFSLPYLSQKLRNPFFSSRSQFSPHYLTNYNSTTFYIAMYVASRLLFKAVRHADTISHCKKEGISNN